MTSEISIENPINLSPDTIINPISNKEYTVVELLAYNNSKGTYTYLVTYQGIKYILKRNRHIILSLTESSFLQAIVIGVPEFIEGFLEPYAPGKYYYNIVEGYIEGTPPPAGRDFSEYYNIIRTLLYMGYVLDRYHIIHGDIKHDNIAFDDHFNPYFIDFDSAIWSFIPHNTTAQYTYPNKPPEVYANGTIFTKSDVWAMGVTFMIITRWPMLVKYNFMMIKDPKEVREVILEVLKDIDDEKYRTLINKMLTIDPLDRWSFWDCYVYYTGEVPRPEFTINLPYPYPLQNRDNVDLQKRFDLLYGIWEGIKSVAETKDNPNLIISERFLMLFMFFVMLYDSIIENMEGILGYEAKIIDISSLIFGILGYPDRIFPKPSDLNHDLLGKSLIAVNYQIFSDAFVLLKLIDPEKISAFLISGHVLFVTRDQVTSLNIPGPNSKIEGYYHSLGVEPIRRYSPPYYTLPEME